MAGGTSCRSRNPGESRGDGGVERISVRTAPGIQFGLFWIFMASGPFVVIPATPPLRIRRNKFSARPGPHEHRLVLNCIGQRAEPVWIKSRTKTTAVSLDPKSAGFLECGVHGQSNAQGLIDRGVEGHILSPNGRSKLAGYLRIQCRCPPHVSTLMGGMFDVKASTLGSRPRPRNGGVLECGWRRNYFARTLKIAPDGYGDGVRSCLAASGSIRSRALKARSRCPPSGLSTRYAWMAGTAEMAFEP